MFKAGFTCCFLGYDFGIRKHMDNVRDLSQKLAAIDNRCTIMSLEEAMVIISNDLELEHVFIVCKHNGKYVTVASNGDDLAHTIVSTDCEPWVNLKLGNVRIRRYANRINRVNTGDTGGAWDDVTSMMGVVGNNISNRELDMISAMLLPKVCCRHITDVSGIMCTAHEISNDVLFIQYLAKSMHRIMQQMTNLDMGVRVALVHFEDVMIFEGDEIVEIPLQNTLIHDAMRVGKARFVSDCASYLQCSLKPATDIFTFPLRTVASIVVLPLMRNRDVIGGIYFTSEHPDDFQNIKDHLMGLMGTIGKLLVERCGDRVNDIWKGVHESSSSQPQQSPSTDTQQDDSSGTRVGSNPGNGESSNDPAMIRFSSRQKCTQAILKVLKNDIQRSIHDNDWIEELTLNGLIGKGGFGMVYKSTWKGVVAAVKVMYSRKHERQIMKDALEMAVLTSVSHPNIVQVYTCILDVVVEDTRIRRLAGDEQNQNTSNVMVMEYCDKGNLRQAIRGGVFHKVLKNRDLAVDMSALTYVLLDVAHSIRYLHSLRLLHCDIKPENVLLKSDNSKPLGFSIKLSDFGLAKMLRKSEFIVNRSGSGTVTHLAPELFKVGTHITYSADSFSFGIMMWEMYTSKRAYQGMGRSSIINHVYATLGRPVFPQGTPESYRQLAERCWHTQPEERPGFVEITAKLHDMHHEVTQIAASQF
jgi:hypothetical protein